MPTASLRPPPRLLTAADLERLPTTVRSGSINYELHHGTLVVLRPHTWVHGGVVCKFAGTLLYQGEFAGHGRACCGGVGLVLGRNPDHVLGLDAAFLCNARLPPRRSPEDYLLTVPDLIVEVRERHETVAELTDRAAEYVDAGARLVWVADPFLRTVSEYRPGADSGTYGEGDTLTAEDIIPGFRLALRLAFKE